MDDIPSCPESGGIAIDVQAFVALGEALDRLGIGSMRIAAEVVILLRSHPRWAIWPPIDGEPWTAVRPTGSRLPGPEVPMVWVLAGTAGELVGRMRAVDDSLPPSSGTG